MGGTRQRHFTGIHSKPHKLPENAQSPTTMAPAFVVGVRVHYTPWHRLFGARTGVPWGSARVIPVIVRDAVLGVIELSAIPSLVQDRKIALPFACY